MDEDVIDMQKLDVMGKMIDDFRKCQVRTIHEYQIIQIQFY